MILEYGNTSKLTGHWYMLELRSEKTAESTLRRVGKAIPSIFRNDPLEIFIPVFKRDLDLFELATGPYIFVRSTSFQSLLRLKTITGVVSLSTEGDSNRPSKAIKVDDSYVQSLIRDAEEEFRNRAIGIEVDSFVRVLNGDTRDYCGVVEAVGDGKAIVRINLKTKSILLETPLRNLLNLSHVPLNQRVYYFCPLVSELEREGNLDLIEDDLKLEDTPAQVQTEEPCLEPKRHSRQKTVTALVKRLILIDGHHEPLQIAKKVVEALKGGDIKVPKNYFIIYCLPGDIVMQGLVPFKAEDKRSTTVLDMNGDNQNITAYMSREYQGELVELTLSGNLPFRCTPEHEVMVIRSYKRGHGKDKYQLVRPNRFSKKYSGVPEWIAASEVKDTDFLLCPSKLPEISVKPEFLISNHGSAKLINTDLLPDKDLAWLFGLYVADGGTQNYNNFAITLNNRTDRNRVASAFTKLGVEVVFNEYDNYCVAIINSVSLTNTFRNWFGADCYTKHFPEFIYGWGRDCLLSLIEGYAEGDGHSVVNTKSYWATTTSYQLAYQIWYLLVGLGCYPSISNYHEGEITNFGLRAKTWMIFWTASGHKTKHKTLYWGDYYLMPVESVSRAYFKGEVHNFSVENTETYVANGIVAHNCILKDHLMRDYFKNIDPSLSNYREVINKYGRTYKFSAQQISEIDPSLKIPVLSSEEDFPEPKKGQAAPKRRGRPRKNQPQVDVRVKKKRILSDKNKEKMIAGLKKWHASRRKEE